MQAYTRNDPEQELQAPVLDAAEKFAVLFGEVEELRIPPDGRLLG